MPDKKRKKFCVQHLIASLSGRICCGMTHLKVSLSVAGMSQWECMPAEEVAAHGHSEHRPCSGQVTFRDDFYIRQCEARLQPGPSDLALPEMEGALRAAIDCLAWVLR